MKNIFVNATSCTIGGSKTVLNQFLQNVSVTKNNNVMYYVFVSDNNFDEYTSKNIQIVNVDSKKWISRIIWDFKGINNWSKKKLIMPNLILSLQNTGVKFDNNIKQIIYLHTPIPFMEYEWSFFKERERKLWFYKNVYPFFIKLFLNEQSELIVQGEWLKKKVSQNMNINLSKIKVFYPNIPRRSFEKKSVRSCSTELTFFYPAMDYKYKNHQILLETLLFIKENSYAEFKSIKFIFTLEEQSFIGNLAKKMRVDSQIDFVGVIDKEEIQRYYTSSNAVLFPSYIETFGLPLLEAATYKKKILSSDTEFAREVLDTYKNVNFIPKFSIEDWAKNILSLVSNRFDTDTDTDTDTDRIIYSSGREWRDLINYIENKIEN